MSLNLQSINSKFDQNISDKLFDYDLQNTSISVD